jgi:hypothetical protein
MRDFPKVYGGMRVTLKEFCDMPDVCRCFIGPTGGIQRSPYAISCYMYLKVGPKKVDHLVLI